MHDAPRRPRPNAPALPLALVALLGCSPAARPARPAEPRPAPRGTVVARVGREGITAEEVRAYAAEHGVTPRAALDVLVDEELLAQRALVVLDPGALPDARWRARIQTLLRRVVEAPSAPEALSTATLDQAYDQLRHDLAPEARRNAVHVLFAAPAQDARARSEARRKAETFRAAVIASLGPRPPLEAFAQQAQTTPGARFERLSPFEASGHAGAGTEIARPFVDATFALSPEAPLSEAVETSFGVHVILLTETLPPSPRIEEETRALVRHRVVSLLRAGALRTLLDQLRARTRIETDPAAVMRVPRSPGP